MKQEAKFEERVAKANRRISQLETRLLLLKRREALRQRIQARREERALRQELGRAVVLAGFGEWGSAEIIGVLLDGMERIGNSPTMKLGMKQRGEEHLRTLTKRRPSS